MKTKSFGVVVVFFWTSDVILVVTVISGMGRAKGEGAGCGFWMDSPRKAVLKVQPREQPRGGARPLQELQPEAGGWESWWFPGTPGLALHRAGGPPNTLEGFRFRPGFRRWCPSVWGAVQLSQPGDWHRRASTAAGLRPAPFWAAGAVGTGGPQAAWSPRSCREPAAGHGDCGRWGPPGRPREDGGLDAFREPSRTLEVGQRALGLEEADACYFEDFGF